MLSTRRLLLLLGAWGEIALGCKVYLFQTFSVGQVLTASQVNQFDVNIRDHVHGAAGVVSIEEIEGAAVASASTTNIWSTDGNTRHITGTVTIVSFGTAPQAGAWKKVIFDGVLTLALSSDLNLPGTLDIITAAGDFAFVYADTTTQLDVLYFRKNGGVVAAAFQSDQETATNTTLPVTPGRQQYHPSAAKAWIGALSGFATVFGSYNVTSLTDTGVGDGLINLTTAFSDQNYIALSTFGTQVGVENTAYKCWCVRTSVSTTQVRVQDTDANNNVDSEMFVAMFGDQ